MRILYSSLHQIDRQQETLTPINISAARSDLVDYVGRLIKDIRTSRSNRRFGFKGETGPVRASIDRYLRDECPQAAQGNAEHLLAVEKKAEVKIQQLPTEIQKGSLFQAFFEDAGSRQIVVSKVDHSLYLDEVDLKRHAGLPWEKRIFKAFLVEIQKGNSIGNVYVYDTNPKMSKYWWQDFLQLSELLSDADNTRRAFELLEVQVFNAIKKLSPADHTVLFNSSLGYFRSAKQFDLNQYINQVFSTYQPQQSGLGIDELVKKIIKAQEDQVFDGQFNIEGEALYGKMLRNVIPLQPRIDLVITDYVANLKAFIKTGEDQDGKFIKIYTDSGYARFSEGPA
jgi:hypothetical protein